MMVLPPYLDPEVRKLDFDTRAKLIYNYHVQLRKLKYELAIKSHNSLTWAAPIQPNSKFNGSLYKEEEEGTPTLRCSDRIINKQKLKDSTETSTSVLDKAINDDDFIIAEKTVDSVKRKRVASPEKPATSTPKAKSTKVDNGEQKESNKSAISKLSNTEIMKRSRLFHGSTPRSKRTDELLENSLSEKHEMEKKAIATAEYEAQLIELSDEDKTLEQSDVDDDHPNEPKGITFRKRISPPAHGKLKRTRNVINYNVSAKRAKPNSSKDIDKASVDSTATKDVQTTKNDKRSCPLCNKKFLQSEIEVHASTCGLMLAIESEETVDASEMIKCELCESYFNFDTDYEVHVKECLRLIRSKDGD